MQRWDEMDRSTICCFALKTAIAEETSKKTVLQGRSKILLSNQESARGSPLLLLTAALLMTSSHSEGLQLKFEKIYIDEVSTLPYRTENLLKDAGGCCFVRLGRGGRGTPSVTSRVR